MKGKFCLLPRLRRSAEITTRFRSLILSILPPSGSAAVNPPRRGTITCITTFLGTTAHLHLVSYSTISRADPESLYPRCIIAAHNHYRVESSLERNKCALDRKALIERAPSRRLCVGCEVQDFKFGRSEPVTFRVNKLTNLDWISIFHVPTMCTHMKMPYVKHGNESNFGAFRERLKSYLRSLHYYRTTKKSGTIWRLDTDTCRR